MPKAITIQYLGNGMYYVHTPSYNGPLSI